MQTIKCNTINKLDSITGTNIDILEISDGIDKYCVFENYTVALRFLGQEIEGIPRVESIKGKERLVLSDCTLYRRVNLLDEVSNFKLYSSSRFYDECNIEFSSDVEGTIHESAVLYVLDSKLKMSTRAVWLELTVADSVGRQSILRWFNPDGNNADEDYKAKYIAATITKSSGNYGYQTDYVDILDTGDMDTHPDVDIARAYLAKIIERDIVLKDFVKDSDLITKMSTYADEDMPELGFYLVTLAKEVYLAINLDNLVLGVDSTILIRGLFASYCFILSKVKEPVVSKTVRNIYNVSRFPLSRDRRILHMLDVDPPIHMVERKVMLDIKNMVQGLLVLTKKYNNYTSSSDAIWGGTKK